MYTTEVYGFMQTYLWRLFVCGITILALLNKSLKLFLLGLSDALLCWSDVLLIILAQSSGLNIDKVYHSSSTSWYSSHYTSAILDIFRGKQQFCILSLLTDPQEGQRKGKEFSSLSKAYKSGQHEKRYSDFTVLHLPVKNLLLFNLLDW